MGVSDLKDWMERHNKSVIEVANILRLHTNTIYKILRGDSVHHLTARVVDDFLKNEKPRARQKEPA